MTVEQMLADAYRHWEAGQSDQAERLCRLVLRDWPDQADALHLLGLMAHAWGNPDLAIEYLQQACRAPRAPALYHSNLCEMCRQRGRLAEAETAGRRAVAGNASLAEGWNNLGIVLQEAGKVEESRLCLERAVALSPQSAPAQGNLGNTLKKLGALDRARAQYEIALALAPDFADAHSNLAVVLDEIGLSESGLAHAERAIELNPRLADAYVNAAVIEGNLGRGEAGLRRLDAVLDFAPQNSRALLARADALLRLERHDEAAAAARQVATLEPANGDAANLLGTVLQALERNDEAMAAYDRAASLLRLPGLALNNKAILLMELGRREEALALLDQVVVAEPTLAPAWFNRADAKTFASGDPDIAAMEALARSREVQATSDRMYLQFALGKAQLDAGAIVPAFAHLAEANRMKRGTIRFDATATQQWMASIAAHFDAEFIAGRSQTGKLTAAPSPVFVIGMPRSGTTLVEQILATHPQIHGAGELSVVRRLVDHVFAPDGTPQPYPQFAPLLDPEHWRRLGEEYLSRVVALAPGAARIVDKMPSNFLYAGLIHLILPQARFIHCRRDPIDTCLSCYTKLFRAEQQFAYDLAELGLFHRGYQGLMAHWRKVLPAEILLEVDYEAVVADLETEARRLVEFCGVAWDERVLRYRENTRAVRTASMNQVRGEIDTRRVGRWRAYRDHLGPLLAALGGEDAAQA